MALNYAVQLSMIDRMTAPLKGLTQQWQRTGDAIKQAQDRTAGFDRLRDRSGRFANMGADTSSLGRVSAAYEQTASRVSSAMGVVNKVSAISGLSGGVLGLGAVNTTAGFEDLAADLKTLEGSSEKAEKSMQWIQKFNADSFYGLQDVSAAFARLRAYGMDPINPLEGLTNEKKITITAELEAARKELAHWESLGVEAKRNKSLDKKNIKANIKEYTAQVTNLQNRLDPVRYAGIPMQGTLAILGDTAASMGKPIMAAVDMMADAIVGENERLKEFGVRGAVNKKTQEIEYTYTDKQGKQQMVSVDKNDREGILRELMKIFSSKYMGAMAERAKTFNGILSNTKDTFALLQAQFMQAGPFERIKASMQSKLDLLRKLSESGKVAEWGKEAAKIMDKLSNSVGWVTDKVKAGVNELVSFVGGWKVLAAIAAAAGTWWLFGGLLTSSLSSIHASHIGIAGLVSLFMNWQRVMPLIQKYFPSLAEWLGVKLPSAWQRLRNAWSLQGMDGEMIDTSRWGRIQAVLRQAFGAEPVDRFNEKLGTVSHIWQGMQAKVVAKLPVFKQKLLTFWESVKTSVSANTKRLETAGAAAFSSVLALIDRLLGRLSSLAESGKVREYLDKLAKAAERLMERFLAFIESGQLEQWFAKAAQYIEPVGTAIAEFATGLWKAVRAVDVFLARMAKFVGGWENLAKIFVGGYIIAMLSGFLQGVAALGAIFMAILTPLGLFVAGIAALAAGAVYLYQNWNELSLKAKAFGVVLLGLGTGILGYIVYAKLAAAATLFFNSRLYETMLRSRLVTAALAGIRAVALAGYLQLMASGLMTSTAAMNAKTVAATAARWAMIALRFAVRMLLGPIGLIITAVTAAVALWQNWDKVMGYLKTHFPAIHEFFAVTLPNALDTAIGFVKSGYEWVVKLADKLAGMAASPYKIGVEVGQEIKKTGSIFEAGRNFGQKWFGGGRAIGGTVEAGKVYRVNEYAPELLVQGNKTFLMASQAGRVVPLRQQPSHLQRVHTNTAVQTENQSTSSVERVSKILKLADKVTERQQSSYLQRVQQVSSHADTLQQSNVIHLAERMGRYAKDTLSNDEPAAPPAGHWTVPQLAAQQTGQMQSRSEVNLRIVSDKPVMVEKLKSDTSTTVNVNTGRMMAGY